jgi:hypothetical protein
MSEEEKAALEAEQAEATANADAEAKDEETSETTDDSKKIDFEAELKKEKEAREKAEKASADLAFKLREKKRKDDEEQEEEEDKPLTASGLEQILAKERENTRKEMLSAESDRIAERLTGSESEKKLVLELHKNRSFPSYLSIEEQIEECYAIANRKKLVGERNEALRALKSKADNGVAGTHQDEPTGSQPKMAAADASEFARLGFKWNGTNRRHEKKLSNGQLLIVDPKTKQTRLVKA